MKRVLCAAGLVVVGAVSALGVMGSSVPAEAAGCHQRVTVSFAGEPDIGGARVAGTVKLHCKLAKARAVRLKSWSSVVRLPTSVKVAKHGKTARFTATTSTVAEPVGHLVGAYLGKVKGHVTLRLLPRPALTGWTFSPDQVVGGKTVTGTVTFSGPVGGGGLELTVAGGYTPGETVHMPGNRSSYSFPVHTNQYFLTGNESQVEVSATVGGRFESAVSTLYISPVNPKPSAIENLPGTLGNVVRPNAPMPVRLLLFGPAPSGGTRVQLTTGDPHLLAPGSVLVPSGQDHVDFQLQAAADTATRLDDVPITATANGGSVTFAYNVYPPGVMDVVYQQGEPDDVYQIASGGWAYEYLDLSQRQPTATTISMTSDNPDLQVPTTITVPADQPGVWFTVQATTVTTPETAHVTLTSGTETYTFTVTIA